MSRKIATLWDNKDSSQPDNHQEHQQAFYAGGSEHSGQQILGPTSNRIEDLINDARQTASATSADMNATTLPITFWRNGFTIGEEGELRDYDNNQQFLEYLRRGETPPELSSRVRGGMIDVKLENKAQQDYKKESKFQAFAGQGHRLGAPTPP